jgi:hypothetical protein
MPQFSMFFQIQSPPTAGVVLVAFIGGRAQAFLPDPADLEIVCWLKPGSTDPLTLSRLQSREAKLFKSDRLHMKVYWSNRNGCVICSANASGSALGATSQKEAGVFLPAGIVDIGRLWKFAKPKAIKSDDLQSLERETAKLPRSSIGFPQDDVPDFIEWQRERIGSWKLGWWTETAVTARIAKYVAKDRYNINSPHDFLNVTKGQLRVGDWALTFRLHNFQNMGWLHVEFVARIDRDDEAAFDEGYPFQAVQANLPKDCPRPPFKLDSRFRRAFRSAAKEYGLEKIERVESLKPPEQLIELVSRHMKMSH